MNSVRLKGIHLAMRTGMFAAETAFDAVRAGDTSEAATEGLRRSHPGQRRAQGALSGPERPPGVQLRARSPGAMFAGLSLVTGGWWFQDPMPAHGGWTRMQKLAEYYKDARPDPESTVNPVKIDRQLTFDRLTNVHYSGTRHPEDQPSHLDRPRRQRVRDALPRGVRQPVHPLLSGERLRDGGRGRRHEEAADQRVELRALQDLRHHGSRTRSSTGCRPKAAAGRNTKACSWLTLASAIGDLRTEPR